MANAKYAAADSDSNVPGVQPILLACAECCTQDCIAVVHPAGNKHVVKSMENEKQKWNVADTSRRNDQGWQQLYYTDQQKHHSIFTVLAGEVMQLPPSVHPFPLSLKPTDLWFWPFACVWVMKWQQLSWDWRSRSEVKVKPNPNHNPNTVSLTSILNRGQFYNLSYSHHYT